MVEDLNGFLKLQLMSGIASTVSSLLSKADELLHHTGYLRLWQNAPAQQSVTPAANDVCGQSSAGEPLVGTDQEEGGVNGVTSMLKQRKNVATRKSEWVHSVTGEVSREEPTREGPRCGHGSFTGAPPTAFPALVNPSSERKENMTVAQHLSLGDDEDLGEQMVRTQTMRYTQTMSTPALAADVPRKVTSRILRELRLCNEKGDQNQGLTVEPLNDSVLA